MKEIDTILTNNPHHPLTPAFPEYVSGHSGFSAASAQALKMFTGSPDFGYVATYDPYGAAWQPTLVESPELIGIHRWLYPSFVSAAIKRAGHAVTGVSISRMATSLPVKLANTSAICLGTGHCITSTAVTTMRPAGLIVGATSKITFLMVSQDGYLSANTPLPMKLNKPQKIV